MFNNLKRFIKWLPIIWADRDWDSNFLYYILAHKLKNMEDFFYSDYTNVANAKKIAKRIKIARILTERLRDEQYQDMAFIGFPWGNVTSNLIRIPNSNAVEVIMGYANAHTPEQLFEAKHDAQWRMMHGYHQQEADRMFLFNWLEKYLPYWWD